MVHAHVIKMKVHVICIYCMQGVRTLNYPVTTPCSPSWCVTMCVLVRALLSKQEREITWAFVMLTS